ncbi:hypothetical protein HHL17_09900 [Chitinophaga sp. G-6-1-13]|uniref:Immunity protein 35 domain-containing protein n=1 Tax=Chitinophaga fulva TaxID=2728842 RepID=A0A848GKG7_9BACT|nr:hypothetical protein [Chitinophaga fulva]NML37502.1 hypothetical protein [Chitinophaga fulva]
MLSKGDALIILQRMLDDKGLTELMLFDQYTIEAETYFVFFCNSKKFYVSGDYSDMIIENTIFILNRSDGKMYYTATAEPIEYYIELFEKGELPLLYSPG